MARPTKQGVDYFPLDVIMDDKFRLIEAEHGIIGFGILIKMYQKIYSEGYYYDWTEREQILFSSVVSVDRNKVMDIINDSVKWGIFDKKLFEKYSILTSRGIQERYIAITYKRSRIEMDSRYLLIDVSDRNNIFASGVSDIQNPNTTIVSDVKSTQSKVKESKVKESICSNTTSSPKDFSDKDLKELMNIYEKCGFLVNGMTSEWLQDLKDRYGIEWVKNALLQADKQEARKKAYVEQILSNWATWGGMKLSTNNKGVNVNKSQPIAKKTRFHNFEQRTDRYSADDLEAIAEKKRQEYYNKVQEHSEGV